MRICALLAIALCASLLGAQSEWNPAKTRVFAVGVLSFQDQSLGTWPDEGRVDAEMIEQLKKRGVPEANIVFLTNAEATREAVEKKLNESLAASAADETFIFYYAGHGCRDFDDDKRPVSLVCYDSMPKQDNYWRLGDVVSAIEKGFKGGDVLITADCCHSGAFMEEVKALETSKRWGVLASVQPGSRSTGNWTFTQCLAEMYAGEALHDADADGKVTLKETAAYAKDEMAFSEEQLTCSFFRGMQDATAMAAAGEKKPERVGERCEAEDEGEWYKVKIIDAKDGKFFVDWVGWGKKWNRWLEADKLRPHKPEVIAGGTVVEVEWDGKWYKAKVMHAEKGLHLVHYEGFPDSDDEYVPRKRIRLPGEEKKEGKKKDGKKKGDKKD